MGRRPNFELSSLHFLAFGLLILDKPSLFRYIPFMSKEQDRIRGTKVGGRVIGKAIWTYWENNDQRTGIFRVRRGATDIEIAKKLPPEADRFERFLQVEGHVTIQEKRVPFKSGGLHVSGTIYVDPVIVGFSNEIGDFMTQAHLFGNNDEFLGVKRQIGEYLADNPEARIVITRNGGWGALGDGDSVVRTNSGKK